MQFEFSATFAKVGSSDYDFHDIWTRLCHDLLAAVFPSNSILRLDVDEYGFDLFDQKTGTAYCCHSVDDPNSKTLSIDGAIASIERAAGQRNSLGWNKYNIATNTVYSDERMGELTDRIQKLQIAPEDVGFLGPGTWSRLCTEYPRVVEDWFEYRVQISKDTVKKAFEEARYYPKYVTRYATQIDKADFYVVLTNNRTPVQLFMPFAPQLTVKHLLDVGKVLLDLSLDKTYFRDLSTSARLSLSVMIDGIAQNFSTLLADIPVPSGGEMKIWIKIIWKKELSDDTEPEDGLPHRQAMLFARYTAFDLFTNDLSLDETKSAILDRTLHVPRTPTQTANPEEQTLKRKLSVVSACIWQKAKGLLPKERMVLNLTGYGRRSPVRLGASAPKTAAPASSFLARFVAYHPDLEDKMSKQLNQWNPQGRHQLDSARVNWKLNTRVKVKVYGEDLVVDPKEDEFCWGGEKHILDFRVHVGKEAKGPHDLKFDVYLEDLRLRRIWIPVEISKDPSDELQSRVISTPRTAFASYSSEDRLRVLDRVAALEIHCGTQVFLDCVSIRPNAKWRKVLPDMILESDILLLFWSKNARNSRWVEQEWRIAFDQKGIDGIEIHPLTPYDKVKLPIELADIIQGSDPLMAHWAIEEQIRSENKP